MYNSVTSEANPETTNKSRVRWSVLLAVAALAVVGTTVAVASKPRGQKQLHVAVEKSGRARVVSHISNPDESLIAWHMKHLHKLAGKKPVMVFPDAIAPRLSEEEVGSDVAAYGISSQFCSGGDSYLRMGSDGVVNTQTYLGPWEKFDFVYTSSGNSYGVYAIKNLQFSKYVSMGSTITSSSSIGANERFLLVKFFGQLNEYYIYGTEQKKFLLVGWSSPSTGVSSIGRGLGFCQARLTLTSTTF